MRRPGGAAQDLVVLPEEHLRVLAIGKGLEAWIGPEARLGPLPDRADALEQPELCRLLPLDLGGQPLPGPSGERIGLLPRDGLDRLVRRYRLEASETTTRPARALPLPGHRRLIPSARLQEPSVGGVRNGNRVDPEDGNLDLVSRLLVVVGPGLVRPQHERPAFDHDLAILR